MFYLLPKFPGWYAVKVMAILYPCALLYMQTIFAYRTFDHGSYCIASHIVLVLRVNKKLTL